MEAALVDLIHGCVLCTGSLPRSPDARIFSLRVPAAEQLYAFKRAVDALDVSAITVFTTPRGRGRLSRLQALLFTPVYDFRYRVTETRCAACGSPARPGRPGEESEDDGDEDALCGFLRGLPALQGPIAVLTSTLIPDCFGHGFSTRGGGVSYIPTLSSLNLFSSSRRKDPVAVVTENRRRLAVHAGFHPRSLHLVKVNHASDVWVVGRPEPASYDAVVTNRPGLVLAAPGADCIPVLFVDPVAKVVAAAHAGWKGTLMGVATATVDAMASEFGSRRSDILVALGPSVGRCCFTLERRHALDFHPDCVPDPEERRPHVDIRLANRLSLQSAGILPQHVHDDTSSGRPCVTPCTSCRPDAFFSHVRDGVNFGTQVGFVWIREAAAAAAEKKSPGDADA